MSITLTNEQKRVAKAMFEFAMIRGFDPYIAVAGYAGTGKTTVMGVVAAEIVKRCPKMRIAYLAPTGKASLVLRDKLRAFGALNENSYTGTVHSYIYTLVEGAQGKYFQRLPSVKADLMVVDEASMIQEKVFSDLLKFKIPIIFIGDSGQLPPVGEKLFPPLQNTDHILETVHRQALDNPIIKVATDVRNGGVISYGSIGTSFAKLSPKKFSVTSLVNQFLAKTINDDTVILCGMNHTRVRLNNNARLAHGNLSKGPYPVAGEKLVCLRNDHNTGLRNGQLVRVASVISESSPNAKHYILSLEDDPECKLVASSKTLSCKDSGAVISQVIDNYTSDEDSVLSAFSQPDMLFFDYGYALSVHKSQGSEWDNVLLFDERNQHMTDDDYRRWLYTGITRAKKKLLILS